MKRELISNRWLFVFVMGLLSSGAIVLMATTSRSSAEWSFEGMRQASCFHDIQVASTRTDDMSEQVSMYVGFFAAQSFRYHEIGLPPMVMVNGQDPGFVRIWLWQGCHRNCRVSESAIDIRLSVSNQCLSDG